MGRRDTEETKLQRESSGLKEITNSCRDEETVRNQENLSKNKVNFGWEEKKRESGRESGLTPFEVQS